MDNTKDLLVRARVMLIILKHSADALGHGNEANKLIEEINENLGNEPKQTHHLRAEDAVMRSPSDGSESHLNYDESRDDECLD